MNNRYTISLHEISYDIELGTNGGVTINGMIIETGYVFSFGSADDFNNIHFPRFLDNIKEKSPFHYQLLSSLQEDNPAALLSRYTETWESALESLIIALLKKHEVLSDECPGSLQLEHCYLYDFLENDFLVQFDVNAAPVFFNMEGTYIAGNHPYGYGMEKHIGSVLKAWMQYLLHKERDIYDVENDTLQLVNYALAHPSVIPALLTKIELSHTFAHDIQMHELCLPFLEAGSEETLLL